MPRQGPRRPLVGFRLSDEGIADIDRLAEQAGVDRSEMIRRMLAYALVKMPAGWQPPEHVSGAR